MALVIKDEKLLKTILWNYARDHQKDCKNCFFREKCRVQWWTLSWTDCDEYLFMKLTGKTVDDYGEIDIYDNPSLRGE